MAALARLPLIGKLGLAILALLALAATVGPALAPDPYAQNLIRSLEGPSASHWLGTDQLGRDLLSRRDADLAHQRLDERVPLGQVESRAHVEQGLDQVLAVVCKATAITVDRQRPLCRKSGLHHRALEPSFRLGTQRAGDRHQCGGPAGDLLVVGPDEP